MVATISMAVLFALYTAFKISAGIQFLKRVMILKRLPKTGKVFTYRLEGFESVVFVDDSVVSVLGHDQFVVGGSQQDKISGHDLAKACAIAMKATSEVLKAAQIEHKGKTYSNKANICVFKFYGKKRFEEEAKATNFKEPTLIRAFANLFSKTVPQATFRAGSMQSIVDKGDLAVHELIHVFGWAYYDFWDFNHEFWTNPEYFIEQRNFNKLGKDRWNELNNRYNVNNNNGRTTVDMAVSSLKKRKNS